MSAAAGTARILTAEAGTAGSGTAAAGTAGVTAPTAPEPTSNSAALEPYEHALRTRGPLYLRRADGRRHPLDVARWAAGPDTADRTMLARCSGPTLDIGCGPGRLVAELVRRGVPALGIDLAAAAVRLTVASGGAALRRSVFDPLPGECRWGTALLADGNIGIGGDPAALLTRTAVLLRTGGRLIVETEPEDPYVHERFAARVEDADGRAGAPFRWARVGVRALEAMAPACGFRLRDTWTANGRSFAALTATA
ncbi:SAM-dependent methyltransferase [Yinghuangia sp. YIM S09857]|uniref:SAM-dependent methyltransferase n=1 Tax=Yinghuangia sp. YIM S09857 TaxID=3436929 RepID=UPI003F53D444